jgi:hypothetical protein
MSLASLLGMTVTGKAYVLVTTLEFIKGDSDRFVVVYECLVMARFGQKFKASAVWDTRLNEVTNLTRLEADVREKAAQLGYTLASIKIMNL